MEKLASLIETAHTLRAPGGCPWDAEQTHRSLVQYLLEETYELIDALEAGDREEVIEELGDVEFYLEGIRQQVDITREQIIAHNMEKLGARYSSGTYSDKQAVTRADEK